ncbi:xrp1 isoform 1-T3 [Glossina fuscipes fuscipes]
MQIPIPTITAEAAFPVTTIKTATTTATTTVPPNKIIKKTEKTKNLILMIREPQTQMISIPITRVQSMQTSNCDQKSNLKAFVEVPKTSTKTRIFLLTRPTKTQYIKLMPEVVSKNENNLNVKTPTTTSVKIEPQTKIIRVPFLSRSRMQNVLVKKTELNYLPLKKETTETQSLNQLEVISNLNTNQSQNQSVITKPSTINQINLDCSENRKPSTLTSMAEIELANADVKMSHSHAEMSGAMPPTATVEEIDVPVFIDEYIRKTSSVDNIQSTIGDNFNIFNNNNTNSYNTTNQNINIISEPCNVKGNVRNTSEIFENFDFDIGLLSEEHQHQRQQQQQQPQCSNEKSIVLNREQQSSEHCMKNEEDLLNELLFVSDIGSDDHVISNKNNNINILQFDKNNNNNNNKNNNTNSYSSTTVNTAINNNSNNQSKMEANIIFGDDVSDYGTESLFKILPSSQYDETVLMDELREENMFNEITEPPIAVMNNDELSLSQCFLNSQPNDILFTNHFTSVEQHKHLKDEISKAEPLTFDYDLLPDDVPMEMAPDYLNNSTECFVSCLNENETIEPTASTTCRTSTKRTSTEIPSTAIGEQPSKRKLFLDIKRVSNSENNAAALTLDTPSVIEYITQDFSEATVINVQSVDTIKKQLEDSCSGFSELSDNTEDYLPPTPCSSFSATNQSAFTDDSNSPCSSKTQNQQYPLDSVSTKRRRGRPAKMHSDIPDESKLNSMSKSERQKMLDRYKNNEASRKSRLKNKDRELRLIEEEKELQIKHNELERILETQRKMETKLTKALKRRHFSSDP